MRVVDPGMEREAVPEAEGAAEPWKVRSHPHAVRAATLRMFSGQSMV